VRTRWPIPHPPPPWASSRKRLVDVATTAPSDLEAFCDHIIGELVGSVHEDDIAVLALRVDRT
jgi:hypothetical protein